MLSRTPTGAYRRAPVFPPVSIVGAPTDVGADIRGTSIGPDALRVAGLHQAIVAHNVRVLDRGNLVGPLNPELPAEGGYRHLEEVVVWARAITDALYSEFRASRLPILLGGDSSVCIGSISAASRFCRENGRPLRVLWFSSFASFLTRETSQSGGIASMSLACLMGMGPRSLTALSGAIPAVEVDQVHLLGLRSVEVPEKREVREHGLRVQDIRCIDEMGVQACVHQALDGLPAGAHLHVVLHASVLDPAIAPGVSIATPGGLDYREAQLVMETIADTGAMRSLDIVGLNPARDERNRTAAIVVDLVESLFGKTFLMREDSPRTASPPRPPVRPPSAGGSPPGTSAWLSTSPPVSPIDGSVVGAPVPAKGVAAAGAHLPPVHPPVHHPAAATPAATATPAPKATPAATATPSAKPAAEARKAP